MHNFTILTKDPARLSKLDLFGKAGRRNNLRPVRGFNDISGGLLPFRKKAADINWGRVIVPALLGMGAGGLLYGTRGGLLGALLGGGAGAATDPEIRRRLAALFAAQQATKQQQQKPAPVPESAQQAGTSAGPTPEPLNKQQQEQQEEGEDANELALGFTLPLYYSLREGRLEPFDAAYFTTKGALKAPAALTNAKTIRSLYSAAGGGRAGLAAIANAAKQQGLARQALSGMLRGAKGLAGDALVINSLVDLGRVGWGTAKGLAQGKSFGEAGAQGVRDLSNRFLEMYDPRKNLSNWQKGVRLASMAGAPITAAQLTADLNTQLARNRLRYANLFAQRNGRYIAQDRAAQAARRLHQQASGWWKPWQVASNAWNWWSRRL